jgi:molecular chaperone GrpE
MKKNKPESTQPDDTLEKETNKQATDGKAQDQEAGQPKAEPSLEEKLVLAEAEIHNWKNKYAMVFADMDNLRKSQDKSFMEALRYRAEGFIDKLIPALDAFHIALRTPVDDPKLKNYLVGFDYIYKQIQQALDGEGVREIVVKIEDPFDVQTMHALETEVRDGPPNRVIKVLSPGYRLHERVIKQALVIVSKVAETNPKETKSSDQSTATSDPHNGNQAA